MKLTKENVYIDLRGKSREELTELYWILKNNNEGFVFIKELNEFLITPSRNNNDYLVLSKLSGLWVHSDRGRETEVTIKQLKEILQPIKMTKNQELIKEAKKRGYTHNNFKCLNKSYNRTSIESLDKWYYNELEDTLFTNTRMNGGKAVYKNGVWAEFKETLQEKEQRLLEELAEVRKEIEENKIKVGDWVYYNNGSTIDKVLNIDSLSQYRYHTQFCLYKESEVKKITNTELIKLLEQEIK